MVKPFRFGRIPVILFKTGMISGLPAQAKKYGKTLLLVTGKKSFRFSSSYAELISGLEKQGMTYCEFSVPGEPSPDDIDRATKELRDRSLDLVVGIGGGSVLDAGKAISAMINIDGSVTDYLEGVGTSEHPGTKLPYIAVPTTSGTGSEATKNAVLSRTGKGGFKKSLRHDNFVPDIALVDPQLTLNCPRDITAASGMDCFTQLTESYLSVKANEYTDALAIKGIVNVRDTLLRCCVDGEDINAREGMSFASLTSGICLANAGLGVIHGFASSIGGLYNIPHGLICGTLMAVSNEINVKILRKTRSNREALHKYATLGRIFLEKENRSDNYYIDGFINYLHNLTSELCLPALKKAGVKEQDVEDICSLTDCKNNPELLNKEDLIEILTRRLI